MDPQRGDCDNETGTCHAGCKDGFRGDACFLECGHCAGNRSCDRYTGRCVSGCKPGYKGSECEQECRHCINRECFDQNGTCTISCEDGYFEHDCEKVCLNCAGDGACDRTTGLCLYGCADGHFQSSCNEACMNCGGNGSCHRQTGQCLDGCVGGFHGDHCDIHYNNISSFSITTFLYYSAFVTITALALMLLFFARNVCDICKLPSRESLELFKQRRQTESFSHPVTRATGTSSGSNVSGSSFSPDTRVDLHDGSE
ncbi:hypothetical protein Btru_013992 [Bulinus truncatus]|nr:hypothetical protein Btru_013992 [Bulinus truncatus]